MGNYGSRGIGVECGQRPADVECPATPVIVLHNNILLIIIIKFCKYYD